MTFQQTVGHDLFVDREVLNFLSQESILLCPDPSSLKHESTPVMWRDSLELLLQPIERNQPFPPPGQSSINKGNSICYSHVFVTLLECLCHKA